MRGQRVSTRDELEALDRQRRPGRSVESSGLGELQRLAGNRAVCELVRTRPTPTASLARNHGHATRLALQRAIAVQRRTGDDHDLVAERFAGQPLLEDTFDNQGRVRRGSDPDAVTRIQQALVDSEALTGHHYDLGQSGSAGNGVDGDYGSRTEAAVRKFKADHDLGFTQFGDVGPGTMGKLDELFRSGGGPPPTLECVGKEEPDSACIGDDGEHDGPTPEVPSTPDPPVVDAAGEVGTEELSPPSEDVAVRPSLAPRRVNFGGEAQTGETTRPTAPSLSNVAMLASNVRCAGGPIRRFLGDLRQRVEGLIGAAAEVGANFVGRTVAFFSAAAGGPIGTFFGLAFNWFALPKVKEWIAKGLRLALSKIVEPLTSGANDLATRIDNWAAAAIRPIQNFWDTYVKKVLKPFLEFAAKSIRWVRNTLSNLPGRLDQAPLLAGADAKVQELLAVVDRPFGQCHPSDVPEQPAQGPTP